MTGLVSTIIPVYNRPQLLLDAVESVLAQTYQPNEVIIVNDGSTDETGRVADELVANHLALIRVLHVSNGGPGMAREAGCKAAQGEFIQYLDSDDLLLPRKFELQVAALRDHPECGIAYGMTLFGKVGEDPPRVPHKGTGQQHDYLFPALLLDRWWSTNTPLYRRSVCDQIGPWAPLANEEDWEYEARAAALWTRLCFCQDFLSVTRSHAPDQHLCYQGTTDSAKLRDRAKAHELILGYAQTAGIGVDQPEMQHFARELFLLSRQCGAAGLAEESQTLFHLARVASTPERAAGWDFRLYGQAANLLGWERLGRLACALDRLRP